MKCIEYSELISAYVDEMLSPQEEEKLMKHLKTCQACQEELEVLKQMQVMCQSIEEVSLPDQFHQDLMKRLKSEKQVKKTTQFKWQYGSALVATMLVGMLFLNQLGMISFGSQSASDYAESDITANTTAERNAETESIPYVAKSKEEEGKTQYEMDSAPQSKRAEARIQDEKDSGAKSEVAEANVYDEKDSAVNENQPESQVSMIQDSVEENVWRVQVQDIEVFIKELKAYLSIQQMDYEETEKGMNIYQVQDSEALTKWLHEHSHSFEGSEITAGSNICLEIK